MKVNKKEIIHNLIEKNGGIIQISDIVSVGISKQYALDYLKKNSYERVAKGVYLSQDVWRDDLYILSLQYKKVVFSHDTALYLLGMAEREPTTLTVTVPRDYKVNFNGRTPIKVCSTAEEKYFLGIETVDTPYGHKVPCYNAERTLCDIFRTGTEIAERQYAMREYLKGRKNIPLLMEYAAALLVERKIKQYTEALL